jgi:hypothetical protein
MGKDTEANIQVLGRDMEVIDQKEEEEPRKPQDESNESKALQVGSQCEGLEDSDTSLTNILANDEHVVALSHDQEDEHVS